MTHIEVLKQALEALEELTDTEQTHSALERGDLAIIALREALAQPTTGDYALGYAEGFNDACKKPVQPQQEPLEYWNALEGWVKINEVREHFDSVGCGTIYKTAGEGRVPLCVAQSQQEPVALRDAVSTVLEGFTLSQDVRKILETAYFNTTPPQRTWVGLTPKDIADLVVYPMNPTADLVRAVEAKLKEKNNAA